MKPAVPLSPAERAVLADKLAAMQAAIARKATTRRLRAAEIAAAQEEVTRVDGRYSHIALNPSEGH